MPFGVKEHAQTVLKNTRNGWCVCFDLFFFVNCVNSVAVISGRMILVDVHGTLRLSCL